MNKPTSQSSLSLRDLPRMDLLLESPEFKALAENHGRAWVTGLARAAVEELRGRIKSGQTPDSDELQPAGIARSVAGAIDRILSPKQCRVINATGVILHTSLGRAPLASTVVEAAVRESAQYACLELDRESGKRSDRDRLVSGLIKTVTGAEAATVVNNNAAATMIILNTLAEGLEVVCSRAHMVEIGGSYRMPDVMRKAGCNLVEVGCTNKTKASDYAEAVTERTAMLLKVHTSNYAIVGFTHEASLDELVAVGREKEVPVVYDLGAGSLVDLSGFGIEGEPTVQSLLATGADLVCFSGDKLFGGPQAGIIVGRRDLVERVKKNALFRMMRCDKVTLALLEHTLKLYLNPDTVMETVPTLAAISRPAEAVQAQAETIAASLSARGVNAAVETAESQIGGGSTPGERLPTFVVTVAPNGSPDAAAKALRAATPSVFCRIENDRLLFDPRTLLEGQAAELIDAVAAALGP